MVKSSVSHVLASEVESLQLLGSAAINGTGNELSNRLVGNSANNILNGAGGSDVMIGGLGDDTYVVDDGSDRIVESEGAGTDTVNSSVSFTLANHLENLSLTGNAAINATGNAANNVLRGNVADNRLDGAQGADRMIGGLGNDTYFVDNAGDAVVEDLNGGNDKVISTLDYTLAANVEALTLSGPALNATGNELSNELIGNERNNRLYGAAGDDFLQGGRGDDRYVFGVGQGQDHISEDLEAAGGIDTIVFEAGIKESDVAVDHSARGMVLRLNDGQQIISGWTAARGHSVERIEFANGTVWNTATLSTQANRAPTVSAAIADQKATEDSAFVLTLASNAFVDADTGDALQLNATLADGKPLPAWLSFDAKTRTFSGTPNNDAAGIVAIRVTATDKAGLSVSDSFEVQVSNTNDAPVLVKAIADQSVVEGASLTFALPASTFADVDVADTLSITAQSADGQALPGWLSYDAESRTFSGTPGNANVGKLAIRVQATDKAGATVSDTFRNRRAERQQRANRQSRPRGPGGERRRPVQLHCGGKQFQRYRYGRCPEPGCDHCQWWCAAELVDLRCAHPDVLGCADQQRCRFASDQGDGHRQGRRHHVGHFQPDRCQRQRCSAARQCGRRPEHPERPGAQLRVAGQCVRRYRCRGSAELQGDVGQRFGATCVAGIRCGHSHIQRHAFAGWNRLGQGFSRGPVCCRGQ
ncbi:putative Ig domain-containing protein [Pseudomonas sp. NA13]